MVGDGLAKGGKIVWKWQVKKRNWDAMKSKR